MIKIRWNTTKKDIHNRLERSYTRLHSEWYTADKVFMADDNNWPGDWEGRTILALTSLGRVLDREPVELEQMVENLFGHLNEKHYLGVIRDKEIFDEQQISGHSWLIRGLIDYYEWKKDERVLDVIKGITHNLMMPTLGYYNYYPMNPEERIVEGEASGNLTGQQLGYWLTSSDTGCAFIMLDGITKAYELLKDKSLEPLIEEMIETYFTLDFVRLSVQTHATLSGLRGVIRYSQLKGDEALIKRCEDVYAVYLAHGRTENYGNYNWFGRPTWTEPCAIVDAFVVSMELGKSTGKSIYIEEANYIYYNALSYAQRENGGFGCDVCSGAEGDYVKPQKDLFEAYWCCTMRGAKGLSYVLEEAIQVDEISAKYLMYLEGDVSLQYEDGSLLLSNQGDLSRNGHYKIDITKNTLTEPKTILLHIPSWAKSFVVRYGGITYTEAKRDCISIDVLPGKMGTIQIGVEIELRKEKTLNRQTIVGVFRYLHGYLMLANEVDGHESAVDETTMLVYEGDGKYLAEGIGVTVKPLMDFIESKDDRYDYSPKKILFHYI